MTSNLSVCCQRAIDRYKSNNSDLAVNLNAARNEIRALTVLLAQHNGDFQRKCEEFAQLKIELRRVETQMSEWRKQIADVFANNARGLNQLMTLLGVQTTAAPNANSNNNGNDLFRRNDNAFFSECIGNDFITKFNCSSNFPIFRGTGRDATSNDNTAADCGHT